MGKTARELALACFDIRTVVRKYDQLYGEVLNEFQK
jgi:hypothetical protein